MQAIRDKAIWLVGASSGIGLSLSKALLENGNMLFATSRSTDSLSELQERFPSSLSLVSGDITQENQLDAISRQLNESTDSLDMIILCAGTCEYDDGPKLYADMYKRVFGVNFFAAVSCLNIALPMLKRARGKVIGISSLASVVPFPRAEAYGASKAALEYFLQSLYLDVKEFGIDVITVRPGFVDTPLTKKNDFDMPFIVPSEIAAQKIIAGIEQNKRLIDFPWQLSVTLNMFSKFKGLWMNVIAKQFRKAQEI